IVKDFKPPELTVTVKDSAAQKIYIGGEVAQPRVIPIRGILRTLDAMILAGGPRNTAQLKNVIILRYNGSQEPDVYSLDLSKVLCGECPDVRLKSYDIVYIPKTTIAKVDLFAQQYIYSLLPLNIIFSFPYDLNPSASDVEVTHVAQ
ncbi:MAG: hypothetical protein IMF11_02140, partial [Proteobacteria bacterium]|nr:hypothetical protein [Pseudomonadota bacterium]